MRKIKSYFFISLDGVVESPDRWHFAYFDDEMGDARRRLRPVPDRLEPAPCTCLRVVQARKAGKIWREHGALEYESASPTT